MELELGLGLPDHDSPCMMTKGLDLNCCSTNEMETPKSRYCSLVDDDEEEEEVDSKSLTSLLLWSGHPNQHHRESDEDEETRGWPPINSWRREIAAPAAVRRSMYVKVKMEGVPIGRKIDLSLYDSYQSFTRSLINNMFAKYIGNDSRSSGNYTISYQDREGDWMLAGDVPWETFVESVQRIEIVRNGK